MMHDEFDEDTASEAEFSLITADERIIIAQQQQEIAELTIKIEALNKQLAEERTNAATSSVSLREAQERYPL